MAKTSSGWLHESVALITGGGSGIGQAVAERYLAEGARVVITGRDQSRLDEVVKATSDPSRILGIAADARKASEMREAVETTVEHFGKLTTLVPNAGIWDYNRSLVRFSGSELEEAFDELFAINVKGYLLSVHAAWEPLVASEGNVVMTLSNAAFHPAGGGPLYTASKFAG